jgi:FixJ family two-component response regulator
MEAFQTSSSLAHPYGKLMSSPGARPQILIVDDDPEAWNALGLLLHSVGLDVEISPTVPEFLSSGRPKTPTCLILDVGLPGFDSLDFQQKLAAANICVPIIFVTNCGDIRTTVQAMKNGAIDFLSKPIRDQDLVDSIQLALAQDRAWCARQREIATLTARFETLTRRERQVMAQVVKGRLNKQVAGDLGISEITVKAHRGKVMRKMVATSLPDLARMADKIGLNPFIQA